MSGSIRNLRHDGYYSHLLHARKEHAGCELPFRVERLFDGAHLGDAAASVQSFEQLLFDTVPADAVLGERRPALPNRLPAGGENRGPASFHFRERARQNVRVQIAVGDMAPDGRVETAALEFALVAAKQRVDTIEGDDHVS